MQQSLLIFVEEYLKPWQTSKMELVAKSLMLNVWQVSEYASMDMVKYLILINSNQTKSVPKDGASYHF